MTIDPFNLTFEPEVFDTLRTSKTNPGIFQLGAAKTAHFCHGYNQIDSDKEVINLVALLRPGCITGDTKILVSINRDGRRQHYRYCTIRQLYKQRYINKAKSKKTQCIMSYNERTGKLIQNKIRDVIMSGRKNVYQISYSRYYSERIQQGVGEYKRDHCQLKCTADHQILTSRGWKRAGDLQYGDRFAMIKKNAIQKKNKCTRTSERAFHQTCFEAYERRCVFCHWQDGSLDVNHLEGNRKTDNRAENLCYLCPNHHRMYSEGTLTKQDVIRERKKYTLPISPDIDWVMYTGRKRITNVDTYDIVMEAPHHNFIAGHTVVHNSMDVKQEDGKSAAEHYVMRLNGEEEVTYDHPSLEPILKDTYGIVLMQEQAIQMTTAVAKFDLVEADLMRQAIGKKDFVKMESMREKFIKGCEEHSGIPHDTAVKIFEVIRASGRYSFNRAHSTSYGSIGCIDLWIRYHHPGLFYAIKIAYNEINTGDKSKKLKLLKDLIRSAAERNITVALPNLARRNVHAEFCPEENKVYLGFNNIHGTGASTFVKIFDKIAKIEKKRGKSILEHTWLEILLYFAKDIGKTAMNNFLSLGMFDHISMNRLGLLYDYNDWLQLLTSTVVARWFEANQQGTFRKTLKLLASSSVGNVSVQERNRTIYDLSVTNRPKETDMNWVLKQEETLIGTVITRYEMGIENTKDVNANLSELNKPKKNAVIAVYVQAVNIKKQKDGREMAFISAVDNDGHESNSICVFADIYKEYVDLLYPDAQLLLRGNISDRESFVVTRIERLI